MSSRHHQPPEPGTPNRPRDGTPKSSRSSWLADPFNRLILVSVLLILFAQVLVPADRAPLWLDVLWIVFAVGLIGAFVVSLYQAIRALFR